jgi:hypothetical protein
VLGEVLRRRAAALGAIALVASVALAGCGGDDGPKKTSAVSNRDRAYKPPATTATTPHPEPPAEAPSRGTDLTTLDGSDPVGVVSSGRGFSVVKTYDEASDSSVTTYDVAGNELATVGEGNIIGACGVADVVVPGRGRLVIGEIVHRKPAEGLKGPRSSLSLKAFDARTGDLVWNKLIARSSDDLGCSNDNEDGVLAGFGATANGRFALFNGSGDAYVIDLRTGSKRSDPNADVVLGNFIARVKGPHVDQASATFYRLADPATGKVVGTLRGPHLEGYPVSFTPTPDDEADLAISSDAGRLFFHPGDQLRRDNKEVFEALSLPGSSSAWRSRAVFEPYIVGAGGGVVLVSSERSGEPDPRIHAYDDKTGKELWSVLAGDKTCGVTNSQLMISVHEQLSVIDLHSGKQVDYDDSQSECPAKILPGGIGLVNQDSSNELTVTQLLDP